LSPLPRYILREHRPVCASMHALINSKLTAMGISVASMVIGLPIHAYTRRGEFEERLKDTITSERVTERIG